MARGCQEVIVAVAVGPVELSDLRAHGFVLAGEDEAALLVLPGDTVEGVELVQAQLPAHAGPGDREELVDDLGHGDQRRAGVKGEAGLVDPAGATTRRRLRLQHRHLHPGGRQPDGHSKAPQARSNHDGMHLTAGARRSEGRDRHPTHGAGSAGSALPRQYGGSPRSPSSTLRAWKTRVPSQVTGCSRMVTTGWRSRRARRSRRATSPPRPTSEPTRPLLSPSTTAKGKRMRGRRKTVTMPSMPMRATARELPAQV